VQEAQATIDHCLIRDNQAVFGERVRGRGIDVVGPNVEFTLCDNEIDDCGTGIFIVGDDLIDLSEEGLIIGRNYVHGSWECGFYIGCRFNGMIANNIIQGSGLQQMIVWFANSEPIVNNILDGADIAGTTGAVLGTGPGEPRWSEFFENNIIMNCSVGVWGPGGFPPPEVNSCLLFNNVEDFEGCEEGENVIFEYPQFVGAGDYHLGPNSPAIDTGNDDYGIDLNFTHNDMGAYGGPNADPDMASRLFGTVIPGQHHVKVSGSVWDGYFFRINAGTILEFDPDVGIGSSGVLDVNGVQGNMVIFRGFQGAAWNGINIGGDGANDSEIEFAEIQGADWDGITIVDTWVNSIDQCFIHDNGRHGIFFWCNDGPTTITNSEIAWNGECGIYIGIDWAVSETVFIGAEGEGNNIHDSDYGLYVIDNDFVSTENVYQNNAISGSSLNRVGNDC